MRLRMLVAYSMPSTAVSTTQAYLDALSRNVDFDVSYIHVTHGALLDVDPRQYDIVFHNYCGRLCFPGYLSESYRDWLKAFKGLKVAAIQDEYDFTNFTKANIKELGFDIVLTCVPQDQLEYVYPKAEFPDVTFVPVLTGYVPDSGLPDLPDRPLAERPIHVGYRGNILPARYGRLGFEKFDIGRRVKIACDEKGIPNDIAMDDASRIYGRQWFEFIGSCRVILGAESGSNAFDFDGSLQQTLKELEREKGRSVTYEEFRPFIWDREKEVSMGQISPRVFEAAAMRTPMILFRGKYSGLIEPEEHYIPLEKDYSNLDEVLSRAADIPALESLSERAYDALVGSRKYTYTAYGNFLEKLLREQHRALPSERKEAAHHYGPYNISLPAADQDLEGFLRIQRPTTNTLSVAYFNWASYRFARVQTQEVIAKEVERLWSVYDELHDHAISWARSAAETYLSERRSLTRSQRRKPEIKALPAALAIEPLLAISSRASRFRASHSQVPLPDFRAVPSPAEIEHAAIEEEIKLNEYKNIYSDISGYIDEMQKEFNFYYESGTNYIIQLNDIKQSTSTEPSSPLLRRLKPFILRKLSLR